MIYYIYDGTFEGLLTVIEEAIEHNEAVDNISSGGEMQAGLFAEIKEVRTEPESAASFFKKLTAGLSSESLMDIAYCYLSEEPDIEKVIFEYVKLLVTHGFRDCGNFTNDTIFKIKSVSGKVSHEIDRLHGFIRFRKLAGGVYYAPVEPDYNVLQFLAPHFKDRFADQKWLIHDLKRKNALYYNGNRCVFFQEFKSTPEFIAGDTGAHTLPEVPSEFAPDLSWGAQDLDKDELTYQQLWNLYFKQIAISERRNKRLQRQRMPARYWRYLVEEVTKDN